RAARLRLPRARGRRNRGTGAESARLRYAGSSAQVVRVTTPTDDPFELPFGGLDLRRQDDVTPEELQASGEVYVERFRHRHRGLLWMLEERPDALKRFRRFVRIAYSAPGAPVTDGLAGDDVPEQAFATGFLSYYAFTGYQVGVRYVVRTMQRAGHTKAHVL